MDLRLYLLCALIGLLGVAFHIFAVKAPGARDLAAKANVPFSLIDYLKQDQLAIISSILTVVILVFLLDEIIGYNPAFIRYVKFGFVFVGYSGSSVLIALMGKFSKGLAGTIDAKTNELDKLKTKL